MNEWTVKSGAIRHIAVIGAGLMGHGIAQVFAQKDYPVTLYDLDHTLLEKALSQIRSNLETFVEVGLETRERVGNVLSNIRTSVDLQEAVKDAHFVIEAAIGFNNRLGGISALGGLEVPSLGNVPEITPAGFNRTILDFEPCNQLQGSCG